MTGDADPAFPARPPFTPVWQAPPDAGPGRSGTADQPFPDPPPFDPVWHTGDAAGQSAAAPADEQPSDEGLFTADAPPADGRPAIGGWDDLPGDPVIQPVADPEPSHEPRWNGPSGHVRAPVAGPPPEYVPGEGAWSALYNSPPPVVPKQTGGVLSARSLLIGAGALVLVVIVALAVWVFKPAPAADSTATTTSRPEPVDAEAQDRLLRALPSGYGPQACAPTDAPADAVAKVLCDKNSDAGGPPSATYTSYADEAALEAAFDTIVGSSQVVVCPGRIQSPGPWRRNATPDKVSGVLLCALDQNRPAITWSDTEGLLIGSVRSGPRGPAFDQLYAWWASHS